MFQLLPYAEAFDRGQKQKAILNQLVENRDSIDDVDFALAKQLIEQQLLPMTVLATEEKS